MKILMLTWEFPPYYTGGLGTACYGMTKALLEKGDIRIFLLTPAGMLSRGNIKQPAFFKLTKPADADSLKPLPFDIIYPKLPPGPSRTQEPLESLYDSYHSLRHGIKEREYQLLFNDSDTLTDINGTAELIGRALIGDDYFLKIVGKYQELVTRFAPSLEFDIIHAHDWITFPAASSLKAFTGKPLIAHIHSTEFDRSLGKGDARIHRIEELGINIADRVIAVSKRTKNQIMKKYRIRNRKRLSVVYNGTEGLNNNLFYRGAKGNKKSAPVVVFIGRLEKQKGPRYFLETAALVSKKIPGARFIIVGEGSEKKHLRQISIQKKITEKVTFTGFLQREQVKKILFDADILLLTSLAEPFGMVGLEAMSAGVVPLIPENSGLAEIAESAIKINVRNIQDNAAKIVQLITNPRYMEKLSKSCREEATKMGWDRPADQIRKIYREEMEKPAIL